MQHQFATSNVAASNDVYLSSYACTIHNWFKGLKSQVMANCFKASRSPHSSLLNAEPDAVGAPSLPSGQRFWRLAHALSASVLCWMSLGHFLLAAPKSAASSCDPRATPPPRASDLACRAPFYTTVRGSWISEISSLNSCRSIFFFKASHWTVFSLTRYCSFRKQ